MTEYYVLKKSLQTFQNYDQTQEIRQQLFYRDTQVLNNIITLLIAILKDPKTDPIMMLQTVRVNKFYTKHDNLARIVQKHSMMILSINSNLKYYHILNLWLCSNIKVKHMKEVNITLAKSLINTQQNQEILYCIWFWNVLLTQN